MESISDFIKTLCFGSTKQFGYGLFYNYRIFDRCNERSTGCNWVTLACNRFICMDKTAFYAVHGPYNSRAWCLWNLRSMENVTSSELAGFCVGALLLCATISAPKVDAFIAASQRSSLRMCRRCGDLRMIACPRCKGSGVARKGWVPSFSLVDDFYRLLKDEAIEKSYGKCENCLSKGHMPCPKCSKTL